jgi:hypothetical protein
MGRSRYRKTNAKRVVSDGRCRYCSGPISRFKRVCVECARYRAAIKLISPQLLREVQTLDLMFEIRMADAAA